MVEKRSERIEFLQRRIAQLKQMKAELHNDSQSKDQIIAELTELIEELKHEKWVYKSELEDLHRQQQPRIKKDRS